MSGPLDQHQIHALTGTPQIHPALFVRARLDEARYRSHTRNDRPALSSVARRVLRRENPEKWRADDNHGGTSAGLLQGPPRVARSIVAAPSNVPRHPSTLRMSNDPRGARGMTVRARLKGKKKRDLERRLGTAARGATSIANTSREH